MSIQSFRSSLEYYQKQAITRTLNYVVANIDTQTDWMSHPERTHLIECAKVGQLSRVVKEKRGGAHYIHDDVEVTYQVPVSWTIKKAIVFGAKDLAQLAVDNPGKTCCVVAAYFGYGYLKQVVEAVRSFDLASY